MHKNQLQELAQRSNVNLPAYSCIREGPDHAPRFKATVNFNGEIFESPEFFSTLRQAEHAAAEVALNVLARRDSSQFLAARVLDETGICKNLLQETAQRAGVSLPVYTTVKGGTGHVPAFNCIVEVGGRVFAGEPAKSKKQAEKNAAMAALSSINKSTQPPRFRGIEGSSTFEKFDKGSNSVNTLALRKRDVKPQSLSRFHGGRSRVRMVNVREQNCLSRETPPVGQFQQSGDSLANSPSRESSYETQRFLFNQKPCLTNSDLARSRSSRQRSRLEGSLASSPSTERSYESQRFLFNQQPSATSIGRAMSGGTNHHRSHSVTGVAFDSSSLLQQEVEGPKRGSTTGGAYLDKGALPRQHQPRASRLSLQSSSDRIELRRPLVEELQLQEREGDGDWLSAAGGTTSIHVQPQQFRQQEAMFYPQSRRAQSERFELKPSLLDELYRRDDDDWWFHREVLFPESERIVAYEGTDKRKFMFYDGRSGSFENLSYTSGYGNESGSIDSLYDSRYRGPISSCVGQGSNSSQRGSSLYHVENCNAPSLFAGFYPISQGGDIGASHGGFNVDATNASFFSNEDFIDTSLGHCDQPSSSRNVHDAEGTMPSSRLAWPHSAQWMTSPPSSPHAASSHSLGLHTGSLRAPPVRVRQMVAVCSAPPPRSVGVESTAATDGIAVTDLGIPSVHYHSPSTNHIFNDAEAHTSDIFKQLRLE